MKLSALATLALSLALQSAFASAADPRPPLKGVSAIQVGNYGAPSKKVAAREELNAIVGELNALRKKPWRQGDTRLSCYATLVAFGGERRVGIFRIGAEHVVEPALGKGDSSYSVAVGDEDLPRLRKLLTEIAPAKNCP